MAMVMTTLILAMLISVRVSGIPLSQNADGEEVTPVDEGG